MYIKKGIKLLVLIILLGVPMLVEASSKEIYFKWDMPVYKKYKDERSKEYKEQSKSRMLAESEVGIGYNYSENIEMEVMLSQKEYVFQSRVLQKGQHQCKFVSQLKHKGYSPSPRSSINHVTGKRDKEHDVDATKRYRPETICKSDEEHEKTEVINKYDGGIVSMKLYNIMPTVKFKLENESRITPFAFVGAGITYATMRGESVKFESGKETVRREKKNKIGFSYNLGIGAKVKVLPKLDVELGVRYFDYGKYKISKEESKGIKGYSASVGVVIKLQNLNKTKIGD